MALPRRFRPYQRQAETQGALRYGAPMDALEAIFGTTTRNYERASQSQRDAGMSLLGSLNAASGNLTQVYNDAGLTPEVLATIGNSPTGQRIAAELARGQAGIVEQKSGAQAGQQFIQQRLGDDYRDDVGQINQQASSMAKERGLYESSLLDELIGDDRARRSEINAAARKAQADAEEAIRNREASQTNALIGQGLYPDERGNLTPLPGGKADPNSRKPKAPSKPTGADRSVQSDFKSANTWIKTLDNPAFKKKYPSKADRRAAISEILTRGEQTAGIPAITSAGLDAALDMYFDTELSPETVEALHSSGAKVKFLPGKPKTRNQRRRAQRKAYNKQIQPNPDQR